MQTAFPVQFSAVWGQLGAPLVQHECFLFWTSPYYPHCVLFFAEITAPGGLRGSPARFHLCITRFSTFLHGFPHTFPCRFHIAADSIFRISRCVLDLFARFLPPYPAHEMAYPQSCLPFRLLSDRDFSFRLNVFAACTFTVCRGRNVRWVLCTAWRCAERFPTPTPAANGSALRTALEIVRRGRFVMARPTRPVPSSRRPIMPSSLSRSIYTPANTITCSNTTTTNGLPLAIVYASEDSTSTNVSAALFRRAA